MIIIKILIPVVIILLDHSVSCDDTDDIRVNRQYVPRTTRQMYKFNHPPAAESYQAIPVAVVYEEANLRTEKSLDAKVSVNTTKSSNAENITEEPVAKTKVSTLTEPKNSKDHIIKLKSNIKVKDEPKSPKLGVQSESNLQIPVVVVYDEPQVKQTNKRNNSPARERVRGFTLKKVDNEPSDGTNPVEPIVKTEKKTVAANDERENGGRVSRKNVHNRRMRVEAKNNTQDKSANKNVESIKTDSKQIVMTDDKDNSSATLKSDLKSGKQRRQKDPVVPIIESENQVFTHNGEFRYSYEGGDGTKAFSQGELKTFGEDKAGESVVGGFSYKDKEGNDVSLSYTADENGYRPVGAHLPTPPPIPKAIARALLYLATKTTPEPVTDAISTSDKASDPESVTEKSPNAQYLH